MNTVVNNFREHEQVAEKIRKFLNLEECNDGNDFVDSSTTDNDDEDTADDFEHIERSDVVSEMENSGVTEPTSEECKTTDADLPSAEK